LDAKRRRIATITSARVRATARARAPHIAQRAGSIFNVAEHQTKNQPVSIAIGCLAARPAHGAAQGIPYETRKTHAAPVPARWACQVAGKGNKQTTLGYPVCNQVSCSCGRRAVQPPGEHRWQLYCSGGSVHATGHRLTVKENTGHSMRTSSVRAPGRRPQAAYLRLEVRLTALPRFLMAARGLVRLRWRQGQRGMLRSSRQ
jgi:hypothetical protein